jgi:hypothetical protein
MQGKMRFSNLKNFAEFSPRKAGRFNEEKCLILKNRGETGAFGRIELAEYNRNNVLQIYSNPKNEIAPVHGCGGFGLSRLHGEHCCFANQRANSGY